MSEQSYTRRRALQLGGAGLVAGLAGCGQLSGNGTGDGNGDGDDSAPLESVPANAAMVAHLDLETLLDGPVVQQGVEQSLSILAQQRSSYEGPESYEDALSMVQSEFGVDPEAARSSTVFVMPGESTEAPGRTAAAAILDADWSESDLIEGAESGAVSFSKRTEGDATVYADEGGTEGIGVLPDGRFVVGSVANIELVVDVVAGDTDPVGGDVVTAYEDAPDGSVRVGADLTRMPEMGGDGATGDIETVSAGMAVDGDQRRTVLEMETADENSASRLDRLVGAGISALQRQAENARGVPDELREAFGQLEEVEVEQNGATVTVSHTTSPEEAGVAGTLLVAVVTSFGLGVGGSSRPDPPNAVFEYEYEADAETVTITHVSGDTIDGSELYVVGTTGTERVERTWASEGVSEVQAGESVTVENVGPDYELRVVWRSEDGSTSATLSVNEGPEA